MSPRQKPLGGKGGGVNEVSEGQQLGWPKADQERIRSDGKAQMWEVKRTELACKRGKEERGRAQTEKFVTRECAVRGTAVPLQAPQRVVCCRAGMEPRFLLLAAPVATAACRVLPRRFDRTFG